MKTQNIILTLVVVFLALNLYFSGFKKEKPQSSNVTIDSIIKTVTIEEKTGQFANNKPTPIYVNTNNDNDKYMENLYKLVNDLQNDNDKLNLALQELSMKVYEKKYEDSVVEITVKDTINGKLQNQYVSWKVKPQQIKTNEIIKTETKKPNFTLSAGAMIGTDNEFNTDVMGLIGAKNKKGMELMLGYTLNKRYIFGIKKDLFVNYKK